MLLDEINIALRYDYIDIAEVIEFLATEKPHMTHVVLTGRNAKDELIEIADLVTEMELVKHPFRSASRRRSGWSTEIHNAAKCLVAREGGENAASSFEAVRQSTSANRMTWRRWPALPTLTKPAWANRSTNPMKR